MKDNLRIWPMKALAALALACGLFPVPVLLGRWLFPGHSLLWWFPLRRVSASIFRRSNIPRGKSARAVPA